METNLTEGNVIKKLLLFAVPIFGANLLQTLYGTVDLLIVGRFADTSAVSAVSTGSMTLQTLTGIVTGLTMGCTILLGHNIGRKDYKACSRTVASSVALFVCVGIILAVLTVIFSRAISVVMNAPEEALDQTIQYIRICGVGLLFVVLFNFLSGMFRGIGDSRTPLILVAIACVFNIFGDLLLVAVLRMGAAGAALATIIAQFVSVVSAALIIRKNGFGFECDRESLKPAKAEITKILSYGVPIAAQDLLSGVSFMVILAIMNSFGLVASAGVGIAEKVSGILFLVPGAIMSGVSAFSAQNFGAGKQDRAKEAMLTGMAVSFLVGLCLFYVTFFHGTFMSSLFSSDVDVCAASADYLRAYSIDCIIVGFNFSMMGYLNGRGSTTFVAAQGILSTFLVRIPVSFLMSRIPNVGLFQVGLATPCATVFAIVVSVAYMLITKNRRIE